MALARGEILDEEGSERVLGWLSLNSDLSMVASAFGFSPHAHREPSHGVLLVNRTGTDDGVRSEVGVLRVSVFFEDHSLSARLSVLDGMRSVGLDLLEYVH
jgi:beta-lactamase class A